MERQKWASTAGAAVSLLDGCTSVEDEDGSGHGAAICSKAVADLHPELEVLHVGTQDISGQSAPFGGIHHRAEDVLQGIWED